MRHISLVVSRSDSADLEIIPSDCTARTAQLAPYSDVVGKELAQLALVLGGSDSPQSLASYRPGGRQHQQK